MVDISPVVTATDEGPWWTRPGLAVITLSIYAGVLAATCFFADNTLRNMMFGSIIPLATTSLNFYFGSSSSSQKKDDALAVSAAKKDDVLAANAAALASSVPVPPTLS